MVKKKWAIFDEPDSNGGSMESLSRELLACAQSSFGTTVYQKASATEISTFYKYLNKSQDCYGLNCAVIVEKIYEGRNFSCTRFPVDIRTKVRSCVSYKFSG